MATLHVRNVPDDTYEALRHRAAEHRTSISAEAVRLLQRALRTDRTGVDELLGRIEAEHRTSISAEAVRLLQRALRTDRAGVDELLGQIEAGRVEARPGAPAASELIRLDRDGR